MTRVKSIFASKTVWAAIATLWVAISPSLENIAEQQRLPTAAEYIQIITLLVTTSATIYGRATADAAVYTPAYMPGPNKPIEERVDRTVEPEEIHGSGEPTDIV